jgi:putative transcriptional regulator
MAQSPISNNIRKLRFYHDEMTQQQLADRVGVAQYAPSLELAFRIAHVFGAPLDEVFTYHPEDDRHLKAA